MRMVTERETMKKKTIAQFLLLFTLCISLVGCCYAPHRTVALSPTPCVVSPTPAAAIPADAAPTPTPPLTVDIDYTRAEPWQVPVVPMDPKTYTVERHALTVPSTAPIKLAHVVEGMQCVLYVGTDENGCQYIAVLEPETGINRKLYTAAEGFEITALARNAQRKHYTEIAAFSWIETDGDHWRLLFNPEIREEVIPPLGDDNCYYDGALSQGSAFLPVYDHEPFGRSDCCALVSTQQIDCFLFKDGGISLPVSLKPICFEEKPVWAFCKQQFVYAESLPFGPDRFSVFTIDADLSTCELWDQLTYRLPDGEHLAQIVRGFSYWGGHSFAILTDKNRLYWVPSFSENAPYLAVQEVSAVTVLYWGDMAYVSSDQGALYLRSRDADEEIHLTDRPVQLTALAPGSVSSNRDDPEQLYAFAQEDGASCVYEVRFPENSKAELTFYD